MFRDRLPSVSVSPVSRTVRGVQRLVQAVAFWTAAVLPLGYLPLLYVGPSRFATLPVFGKLLSLNLVALLVGHRYRSDDDDDETGDDADSDAE